jgi:K+-sensing histidine kinase KdpD
MRTESKQLLTMNTSTATISTLFPQLVISRTRQPFASLSSHDPFNAARPAANAPYERRDLASLLRLVAWIFQPLAKRKGVTLAVNAPVAGLNAVCDEVRLQRVLETLLTNAINLSPADTTITLTAGHEGNLLRFTVEDEGAGVSPDEQDNVFEGTDNPLIRFISENSGEDNELAACRRIVNAHGGFIKMHNRATGGECYEFSIPTVMPRLAVSNVA